MFLSKQDAEGSRTITHEIEAYGMHLISTHADTLASRYRDNEALLRFIEYEVCRIERYFQYGFVSALQGATYENPGVAAMLTSPDGLTVFDKSLSRGSIQWDEPPTMTALGLCQLGVDRIISQQFAALQTQIDNVVSGRIEVPTALDFEDPRIVLSPWMLDQHNRYSWTEFQAYARVAARATFEMMDTIVRPVFQEQYMNRLRDLFGSGAAYTPEQLARLIDQQWISAKSTLLECVKRAYSGEGAPEELDVSEYQYLTDLVSKSINDQKRRGSEPITMFSTLPLPENIVKEVASRKAAGEEVDLGELIEEERMLEVMDPWLKRDALYLVDLPMTCKEEEDAIYYLKQLDLTGAIPYTYCKAREDFNNLFRIIYNHHMSFCRYQGGIRDDEGTNLINTTITTSHRWFHQRQSFSPSMEERLVDYVNRVWQEADQGEYLFPTDAGGTQLMELASGYSLEGELVERATQEREAIIASIRRFSSNPQSGPAAYRPSDARHIPYTGFEEAEHLYQMWIVRQVREAFARLNNLAKGLEIGEEYVPGFRPTMESMTALLEEKRANTYDAYLAAYDYGLWGSVIDDHWQNVVMTLTAEEGNEFESYAEFMSRIFARVIDRERKAAAEQIEQLRERSVDVPEGAEDSLFFSKAIREPAVGDIVEGKESGSTAEVVGYKLIEGSFEAGDAVGYLFVRNLKLRDEPDSKLPGLTGESVSVGGARYMVSQGLPPIALQYESDVQTGAVATKTQDELQKALNTLQAYEIMVPADPTSRERWENIVQPHQQQLIRLQVTDWRVLSDGEIEAWKTDQWNVIAPRFEAIADVASILELSYQSQVATKEAEALAILSRASTSAAVSAANRHVAFVELSNILHEAESKLGICREMVFSEAIAKVEVAVAELEAAVSETRRANRDEYLLMETVVQAIDTSIFLGSSTLIALIERGRDILNTYGPDINPAYGAPGRMGAALLRAGLTNVTGRTQRISDVLSGINAGLFRPPVKFEGMRPGGEFHVENFSQKSLKDVMKWVRERIDRGMVVEPKLHGFRAALEVRNGVPRIFLEGEYRNFSDAYSDIAEAIADGPDVVMEAEIVRSIGGVLTPRPGEGAFTRKEIDSGISVAVVFEALYYDGETLDDKPFEDRRQAIAEWIDIVGGKHVLKMPGSWCNTETEVLTAIQRYENFAGSEGAMLKVRDSKYTLGNSNDWAKVKARIELTATVIGKKVLGTGAKSYECGVVYDACPMLADDELVMVDGIPYVKVGATFGTSLDLAPGETIAVAVTELLEHQRGEKVYYRWEDPKVVGKGKGEADSIGRAIQVGQILQASISQPYRTINNVWQQAMKTNDIKKVIEYKDILLRYRADLNSQRLIDLADTALMYCRDRIATHPVAQMGDVGVATNMAGTSETEYQDILRRYEGVAASVDTDSQRRMEQLRTLAQICNQRESVAEDEVLARRFHSLWVRITADIASLANITDVTPAGISKRISEMRREAEKAVQDYDAAPEGARDEPLQRILRLHGMMVELVSLPPDVYATVMPDIQAVFEILDSRLEKEEGQRFSYSYLAQQLTEQNRLLGDCRETLRKLWDEYDKLVEDYEDPLFGTPKALDAKMMQDLVRNTEERMFPKSVIAVVRSMFEAMTEAQYLAFQYWGNNVANEATRLDLEWQDFWNTISNIETSAGLDIDRLYASGIGDAQDLAVNAIRKFAEQSMTEEPAVSAGTLEVLNALSDGRLPDIAGQWSKPWREVRQELILQGLMKQRPFVVAAAERFKLNTADEDELDVDSFMASPLFTSLARGIVEAADRKLEAHVRAYEVWKEDESPYPLAEEGVCPEEIRWYDEADLIGMEKPDEKIVSLIEQGKRVLAGKNQDGSINIVAVVDRGTGDYEGAPDLYVEQVVNSIVESLEAEPTVANEVLPELESHIDRVRQSISSLVQVGDGCTGTYVDTEEGGRAVFVVAAHCVHEDVGEQTEVRALTGEEIPCHVVSKGRSGSAATDQDLAVLVADPYQRGKTDRMRPLSIATPPREGAAVVVSPRLGEADVVVRSAGYNDRTRWDLYEWRDRARQGYSGSPLIGADGSVYGIWSQSVPLGAMGAYRPGFVIPARAIISALREAGVLGPQIDLLAEQLGARVGAALTPRFMSGEQGNALSGRVVTYRKGKSIAQRLSFSTADGEETGVTIKVKDGDDLPKLTEYRDGARLPVALDDIPDGEEEQVDRVQMLVSRIRDSQPGNRYYEFYLRFEDHPELNGLWAISEEAAEEYGYHAFMFKMVNETPFWMRDDAKHAAERSRLEEREKPSREAVQSFLGRPARWADEGGNNLPER